ncbi:ferredoxin [Qaidamihabitans albus]|uniref:ferredoxin n=1 Tax=Qaidamihabitans albus TaxID=2795733 RepID=UPI0018F10BFB|nr:ferredoxin [Qaidamihabitans albus]
MSRPPVPLTAEQQQQLVQQIGYAFATAAPRGWRQLRAEYRAVGRHIEVDAVITGPDGVPRPARPPEPAVRLLGTLRSGMYRPGRGTWLGAVLVFDPAEGPRAEFGIDAEPRWRRVPPPVGFQDELRFFPRADEYIPDWFRLRAGLPAAGPEPGLRTPRVYDGLDEAGRPVVERPPLAPAERDRVLGYLEAAPVVLAARSYDDDVFDPGRPPSVPLNFRTDGTWVWPGAVAYYLREHEVAPDPDLLTHIRARNFTVPEVGEPARELAVAAVTGQPSTEG